MEERDAEDAMNALDGKVWGGREITVRWPLLLPPLLRVQMHSSPKTVGLTPVRVSDQFIEYCIGKLGWTQATCVTSALYSIVYNVKTGQKKE